MPEPVCGVQVDWCDADDPEMPHGCPMEPERYVRAGCVHEHIRQGWLCAWHLQQMLNACCRICRDLGHDCQLAEAPSLTPR